MIQLIETNAKTNAEIIAGLSEEERGIILKLTKNIWARFAKCGISNSWMMQLFDPCNLDSSEPERGLSKEQVKTMMKILIANPEYTF